jgi:hypothetical protein
MTVNDWKYGQLIIDYNVLKLDLLSDSILELLMYDQLRQENS